MNTQDTPVLLIIFNRPKNVIRLINILREIKPLNIYVVADGPRKNKTEDKIKCTEARAVLDQIDWPCNIHKKFFDDNQGCDPTVEAGIDWFFENNQYGIILEDDCIPDKSFFNFATKMLEKYKDDYSVMHINGSNFQFGKTWGDGSYYFSRYAHSWGWATWKRAWQKYDTNISSFPDFKRNNKISLIIKNSKEKSFWLSFFQKIYNKKFPFWDSRWAYAIWSNNGKCITPNSNLIDNIGWDNDATHTNGQEKITKRDIGGIIEIKTPTTNEINNLADETTFKNYYYRSFLQKLKYKIREFLK